MPTNFTLQDMAGTARAVVAFAAILFCPGYLLAQLDVRLGCRRRGRGERFAWSVALSFAVAPMLVYIGARATSFNVPVVAFAALAVAALAVGWRTRETLTLPSNRETRWLLMLLLFAAVFAWFELVDLQIGNRLYLSVTALDQAYRVAFVDAIARTGITPSNPLYLPGHAAPLRYYYFWYALCAAAARLAHASPRQALMASSVWAGAGLVSVIALFARHFLGIREGLRRFLLVAVMLLSVTGLDLLPVLANLANGDPFRGDLEWWSTDQVTSWLDTMLWVPNHLAALVCCLVAFLALWLSLPRLRTSRQRAALIAVAATSAAGSLGLSVYLAAGFALLAAAWAVRRLFARQPVAPVLWAAVGAAALSLPFLRELTAGPHVAGPPPLGFGVRKMIDSSLLAGLPAFATVNHAHPFALDQAMRLLLLVPGYFVELGFFGLALIWSWRRRHTLDAPRRTALFLAVAGLVLVTFVRSTVIGNNDFGYRAALLPSFFLLLLGTDLACRLRIEACTLRWAAWVALAIGCAGTLFQAGSLRLFVPVQAARHGTQFDGLPQLSLAQRRALESMQAILPPTARLQFNPAGEADFLALGNLLGARRQFVVDATEDCGAPFGGSAAACSELRRQILALYREGPPAAEAAAACGLLGIDDLIATSRDPAWARPESWVWTLQLVTPDGASGAAPGVASGSVRIVRCSQPQQASRRAN